MMLFAGCLLTLCCLAMLLAQIPGAGQDVGVDATAPPVGEHIQPSGGGTGVPPPKRGNCANVGADIPENPFRGWPVKFYEGSWRTISAWWCDPLYYIDFGASHWGIDIAAQVELSEGVATYYSIFRAEVVNTLREGYGYVISAREDGGWHYGMGNHVKVMALTCEEVCGYPSGDPEPGEVYFPLEKNSPQCAGAPGGTVEPSPKSEDLVLACLETGWVATYMHLESISVAPLQLVERGDVLGRIDSTGNSTGDHLHYQINGPGVGAIDPAPAMCAAYDPEIRVTPR
jgi:murein DD-endopeptidase MepM/ murein hydrolase activator NlpD